MIDPLIPSLVVFLATSLAAAMDLRYFRISNRLILSLLALGLCYHSACEGWQGLGFSLMGAAFGFFALILPHAAGGMGAGDVKLLAGVGAWLGLPATFAVLVSSMVATIGYAVILTLAHGRVWESVAGVRQLLLSGGRTGAASVEQVATQPDRRQKLIPFAAMVVLGMLLLVARTWWTGEAPSGFAFDRRL